MNSARIIHKPSVTRWIGEFRDGDDSAANLLWGFLRSRLISLASGKAGFTTLYDEEDIAISAFATLCDGLKDGRYDNVGDRDSLWSLLAMITINRARTLARNESRLRRGGGSNRIAENDTVLSKVESNEQSPEFRFLAKEECRRMLALLPDKNLKLLAILKVDGHTNEEIAGLLECSRRSVQRRLNLIRDVWANELP